MHRPLPQELDGFRRRNFVVCNCGLEVLLLLVLEPLADHAEGLSELRSLRLLRLLLRLLLLLLHGRGRRRGQPRVRE